MELTAYERGQDDARAHRAHFRACGFHSPGEMSKSPQMREILAEMWGQVNNPAYPEYVRSYARGYLSQADAFRFFCFRLAIGE